MKIRIITVEKLEGDIEGKEKTRRYQRDGQTILVPVGIQTKLTPEFFWVADLAKSIGDIKDFIEIEE